MGGKKNMNKRVLALLLAFAMVFTIAVLASAQDIMDIDAVADEQFPEAVRDVIVETDPVEYTQITEPEASEEAAAVPETGTKEIFVRSDKQFPQALQYAIDNPGSAVDIHISGTVSAPNGTIVIPKNVHLYIDEGAVFSINGNKEVLNYGVIFINGVINHSNNVTNIGAAQVILGNTGTIKGNQKFLTNGDVLDTRGNWEIVFDANGGLFGATKTVSFNLKKSGADGYTVSPPSPPPAREGYIMLGWYTEAACANEWDFSVSVNTVLSLNDDALILYAKWQAPELHIHMPGEEITAVEPTCTLPGLWEIRCTECEELLESGIMDELGHEFVQTAFKEATCGTSGLAGYECCRCDDSNTVSTKATGHKPGARAVTKEAVLDKEGAWEICCQECREVLQSGIIAASVQAINSSVYLKHTYGGEVNTGDIYFLDVMMAGNLDFSQVETLVAYDHDLFEYAGKVQFADTSAKAAQSAADTLSARGVTNGNISKELSGSQPVLVARLLFKAKDNLAAGNAIAEFSIAAPALGIGKNLGDITSTGNTVRVTVNN